MIRKLIVIVLITMCGLVCVSLLMASVAHKAKAMSGTPTWRQVGADGIGDPANGQIPSLAVFNDYLYAGTWHNDGISLTAQIWRT